MECFSNIASLCGRIPLINSYIDKSRLDDFKNKGGIKYWYKHDEFDKFMLNIE